MKLSFTKDTFIAFLIVVGLAGAALGAADETQAMLNPQDMAKLGIHKMPNGEWMQEAVPASAEGTPGGGEHDGHTAEPEAAPAPQQAPQHQMPDGQMMDHEMMGH